MTQTAPPDTATLVESAIVSRPSDNGVGPKLPPAKRTFTLHAAREAWEPQPPKNWLVEGLIAPGDVCLLFGDAGVGKTWLFTDLAVSVATGAEWLGKTTCGAPVLIIDEESGFRRLTDRLARTMRGHRIAPGTLVPVNYIVLAGFNFLADPTCFTDLDTAIRETDARLVIIDALADIMLGGDENAVADTQPVFHGLRVLAEQTGVAIVVIHHSNKAGGYRGSTAISGAVDLSLQVSRSDAGTLKIESVKARDVEPITFGCRPTWDALTNAFCLDPVDLRPVGQLFGRGERYVLRYLWEHPNGASKRDIENGTETCSSGTARNAIYNLVEKGLSRRTDEGKQREAATFALTIEGKRAAQALV